MNALTSVVVTEQVPINTNISHEKRNCEEFIDLLAVGFRAGKYVIANDKNLDLSMIIDNDLELALSNLRK